MSAAEVLKDNEFAIPLVSQIAAELPDVGSHIENDVYFSRLIFRDGLLRISRPLRQKCFFTCRFANFDANPDRPPSII